LNGKTYRYQIFVPASYTSTQRWPTILFLHGAGERGNDGYVQTQVGLAPAIRQNAARFPAIADFYYREVVSRGLAGMRALIELGIARGEIKQKSLARFPQILVAPALIAVIWQSLFSRHAPLDAIEMFRTHLDLIFGERRTT